MTARDTATSTDHDGSITATANAPQIVQIESLGKLGLMVILVMFLTIVALAFFTGRTDGLGEARAEDMDVRLRRMDSRVSVIEYDSKGLCGQLLAKNIVEVCH